MRKPALLAISHGTSSPAGQAAVEALMAAVARRLPDTVVRLGHVDVQQPDVPASLDSLPGDQDVVIVPLLLSAGYHVRVDIKAQAGERDGVRIADALGPDPRLVDVLLERLEPITEGSDAPVVLAVAGSSDERANDDCRTMGAMLADRLGAGVEVGFLAATDPRLDAVVAQARATSDGPRRVASYLLAPGYFHDLAVRLAGGAPISRPLLDGGDPPAALVDIIVDRYSALA